MMGKSAAKHVGYLPDIIEQLIGMRNKIFIKKREMILEVSRPHPQIKFIMRGELLHGPVLGKTLRIHECRTPLIAWMAVDMQDSRIRKILPKPGKTQINSIKL